MSEAKVVNLSELRGKVAIDEADKYYVELPDCDHFVVMAGANYPDAATNFEHPNVAAFEDKVFETRAYWPSGRKKWFSHAGRDFYFIIPRRKIELVFEKGYSYVPVIINGLKLNFNVSGGTLGGGWGDWVRQFVHVGIGFTKAKLVKLAEVAVPVAEAGNAVKLQIMELSQERADTFRRLVAGYAVRKELAPGHQIQLATGYSAYGSQGPFPITNKNGKRGYICQGLAGIRVQVQYQAIDNVETARLNNIAYNQPTCENRIGPVVPYAEPVYGATG